MKQRLLFLYLNTGAGHAVPARVLKQALEKKFPGDVSVELLNGFSPRQVFSRLFFEKGYHAACNFIPGAFPLIYELGRKPWFLKMVKRFVSRSTSSYIASVIKKRSITKVVSFHFALTPAAALAVKCTAPPVPLAVVVTDPYTAPPAWFVEKDVQYVVFSDTLAGEAVRDYGISAEKIHVMPFLFDPKFRPLLSAAETAALRRKHGVPEDKKLVLVAGGGEGLPGAARIVTELIRKGAGFAVVVVCGRNHTAKKRMDMLARRFSSFPLKVFGFVPFMEELVQMSDCVVTKAGASTVMEVLACRKPVIFSTFIHGQEQGNVRFVVTHRAGFFVRKPGDIHRVIVKLFTDSSYEARILKNLEILNVHSDADPVCDFIWNLSVRPGAELRQKQNSVLSPAVRMPAQ